MSMPNRKNQKKTRKIKVPHTYALLFYAILLCAILTYIVPAGYYERVMDENTHRMVLNPDSFEYVKQTPVSFFDIFKSIQYGMEEASSIIFCIFIIGGSFAIIQNTGVIDAGINKTIEKLSSKKEILLIVIMVLFSIGGGTYGLAEEMIIFAPIAISLCRKLGYDDMVGLAIVTVGARAGFTTGLLNPFTVGVAQGISELPLFSGLGYRFIWYVLILLISVVYTIKYARKVEKDPSTSILHDIEPKANEKAIELPEFTTRHRIILLIIVTGFSAMFYGVFRYGWYIAEISGVFLLIGVTSGIIRGFGSKKIAESFIEGAKSITYGALVVGLARATLVILKDGNIIDSVLHSSVASLSTMPRVIAANGMYIFQLLLNILIPSGSGQAAVTMPIMAPLSDLIGITRQTAVLAFHYGDGFTNLISPTNGTLMACLAVSGIPYEKWAKWMGPLLGLWLIIGLMSVTIATLINLGPF